MAAAFRPGVGEVTMSNMTTAGLRPRSTPGTLVASPRMPTTHTVRRPGIGRDDGLPGPVLDDHRPVGKFVRRMPGSVLHDTTSELLADLGDLSASGWG